MAMKIISRFGSWASPITSEMVSSNSIHFEELRFDGEEIYWLEFRPSQSGRQVIVRYSPDGMQRDLTPPDFNVRTKVHEYGGGAYLVYNGIIYFTNFADQRVYRQLLGKSPEAITPVGNFRFADYCMDDLRQNLICIREEHSDNRPHVENTLVSISLSGVSSGQVLVSGNDFYSNPRLSPDNRQLAWLTWNHPNMPWDGCELWLADLDPAGNITHTRLVVGGQDESIFQPEWSPEGVLHFISDRTGWWNLYRWKNGKVEPLHEIQAEFGLPQWVFGLSTYGFSSQNEIICSYRQSGKNYLARLNTKNGNLSNIQNKYAEISSLCIRPGKALFVGGSIDRPAELVLMDLSSSAHKFRCFRKRIYLNSSSNRVPLSKWSDFLWKFLSSCEQKSDFPACGKTTINCHAAWRPYIPSIYHFKSENSILDQSWFCHIGCQLQWQHWIRAGLSKKVEWQLGHHRCNRLHQWRKISCYAKFGGWSTHVNNRRVSRRLHRTLCHHLRQHILNRGQPIWNRISGNIGI
jgi:hypothetical protein